ncbi:hypothetical protein [Alicyclobacillus herbarius]|uniref:hypothetical protein n=1 Tax=Alicyclobacillus herbarius TaxID=122960 RepID=UPI000400FDE4|nr:hypothetical protein [Alicyclobacillus herbarius]
MKNGWSPYVTGNWRINSIGYIHGHGRNYVIAVLTSHNSSEDYGIDTVDEISRLLWTSMARLMKRSSTRKSEHLGAGLKLIANR